MHDKETGERPAAKPGLSGWVEGMDEADDGYLAHGETIDAEPVSRSVSAAAPDDGDPEPADPTASSDPGHADPETPPTQPGPSRRPPPRPSTDNTSSASRSGRGRRTRLIGMGLVGLAVVGGLLIARHYTGAQPLSLKLPVNQGPSASAATHAAAKPTTASTSVPASLPVAPQTAVSAPETPAMLKPDSGTHPTPMQPKRSASTDGPSPLKPPSTDDITASATDSRASAHTLDDLHTQLSTLETQMAGMRDKAKSDTAANRELKDQIVALHRALHDVYERMGTLTSGMGSAAAKTRELHGYRLLAVVGTQAVIEELATGKAAVLGANGHLGTLTVYQVNKGQVVTNFGVF